MTNRIDIFEDMPLIYPAQSKLQFFCRNAVCEFVLRQGGVPLHPFKMFGYFLDDRVERDLIRRANNSVVGRADQIWVFGSEIADGVLLEISLAYETGRPVRFFTIATRSEEIVPLDVDSLSFENELVDAANGDIAALRHVAAGARTFQSVVK